MVHQFLMFGERMRTKNMCIRRCRTCVFDLCLRFKGCLRAQYKEGIHCRNFSSIHIRIDVNGLCEGLAYIYVCSTSVIFGRFQTRVGHVVETWGGVLFRAVRFCEKCK